MFKKGVSSPTGQQVAFIYGSSLTKVLHTSMLTSSCGKVPCTYYLFRYY